MEDKAIKRIMAKRTTQNYFLLGAIIFLVVALLVLSLLNRGQLEPAEEFFTVSVQGGEATSVTLADLEALNPEEFVHVLQSKGKEPVESSYIGIPLSRILAFVSSDFFRSETITVKAEDGHTVSFETNEVNQPEHIYLVWLQDGELLGTMSRGGKGPFMIIPRQDDFGQRWCKFLVEVSIE